MERLKEGKAIGFGSSDLPHSLQIVDGHIVVSTRWVSMQLPDEIARYIGEIVEHGLLDDANDWPPEAVA